MNPLFDQRINYNVDRDTYLQSKWKEARLAVSRLTWEQIYSWAKNETSLDYPSPLSLPIFPFVKNPLFNTILALSPNITAYSQYVNNERTKWWANKVEETKQRYNNRVKDKIDFVIAHISDTIFIAKEQGIVPLPSVSEMYDYWKKSVSHYTISDFLWTDYNTLLGLPSHSLPEKRVDRETIDAIIRRWHDERRIKTISLFAQNKGQKKIVKPL